MAPPGHPGPTLPPMLRTVIATRYVTPLREGGSVPALVEADDDGLYVVKLLGAGHGRKALIAELMAGEIGRRLGLPVPDAVLVELDGVLAKAEPDQEIQELLARSSGTNYGLTSCRVRCPLRLRLGRGQMPTWRPTSSGLTPSPPTWTGHRATPTCSCGIVGCT